MQERYAGAICRSDMQERYSRRTYEIAGAKCESTSEDMSAIVSIRQHTSAYVSIRIFSKDIRNSRSDVRIDERRCNESHAAYCIRSSVVNSSCIRQHASAHVSIRQHNERRCNESHVAYSIRSARW